MIEFCVARRTSFLSSAFFEDRRSVFDHVINQTIFISHIGALHDSSTRRRHISDISAHV